MLRLGLLLFLSVLLMLQSRCCANSDDIQDDEESDGASSHEVVDSFPRSYNAAQYPWRLWNFPYYQPRTPQIPIEDDDAGEGSPPFADPRFVTNRCGHRQSYSPTTTYPCFTTYFTTAIFTTTTTITTTTTVYPTTDTTTDVTSTSTTSTDPSTTSTDPSTTSTDPSTTSTDPSTTTAFFTTIPPVS